MTSPEWERITAPLDKRRVVYWSLPVTDLLRASIKRDDAGRYVWTVHRREQPRFAWTRAESGDAATLATAKRAGAWAVRTCECGHGVTLHRNRLADAGSDGRQTDINTSCLECECGEFG